MFNETFENETSNVEKITKIQNLKILQDIEDIYWNWTNIIKIYENLTMVDNLLASAPLYLPLPLPLFLSL